MGIQKPSEKSAKPGEYKEVGPRGGKVKNPKLPFDTRSTTHLISNSVSC